MTPADPRGATAPRGSGPTVRRSFRISGEPTPRPRAGSGADRIWLWASMRALALVPFRRRMRKDHAPAEGI